MAKSKVKHKNQVKRLETRRAAFDASNKQSAGSHQMTRPGSMKK